MADASPSAPSAFDRLFSIIRTLRGPKGCQWDLRQTPHTLRSSLAEETWETVGAIEAGDDANLREELGDLYLLATMIAYMKQQEGAFSVEEVLDEISAKLVRRHPHVFAGVRQESVEGILAQWDRIKWEEKNGEAGEPEAGSVLDRLARGLPPLERALAIQRRVAKVGFDWQGHEPVWDKLAEESTELRKAASGADRRAIEEEVGDLLFTVVNLARLLGVDPSLALRSTNEKFERRFREVERRLAETGTDPRKAGLARMDALWNQLKEEERKSSK